MIWYNMKEMCKHYKLAYSTIRSYNNSNFNNAIAVELLMLSFFAEKLSIDKKDLESLSHFFKRKRTIREEIVSKKELEKLNEKYWNIDKDFLEIGRELYLWNLSKEDLRAIQQIKSGGEL